jgi:RNA 2',3'-cyclic 3'-phosphodiesterase
MCTLGSIAEAQARDGPYLVGPVSRGCAHRRHPIATRTSDLPLVNYFLALRLADEPRDRLATLADRFQEWALPARWVHPEDYHLTLLFLGECDEDELRTLPWAINDVAQSLVQPQLRFAGLGATGGKTEPKVVYAACEDATGLCAMTHRGLAESLGMPSQSQFLPHVTLCRPQPNGDQGRPRGDWPQLLAANGEADWGTCGTTHLVLYRATTRRPRYEALESWPLIAV